LVWTLNMLKNEEMQKWKLFCKMPIWKPKNHKVFDYMLQWIIIAILQRKYCEQDLNAKET